MFFTPIIFDNQTQIEFLKIQTIKANNMSYKHKILKKLT